MTLLSIVRSKGFLNILDESEVFAVDPKFVLGCSGQMGQLRYIPNILITSPQSSCPFHLQNRHIQSL